MRPSSTMTDLARELEVWKAGQPPARAWVTSALCELLGASFTGVYRPVAIDDGWALDFMHAAGERPDLRVDAFRRHARTFPATDSFGGAYKPYCVEVPQRNRPMRLSDFSSHVRKSAHAPTLRAVGVPEADQLRVLLCDGPRMLAWLGATRSEPFTTREVHLLRYFVRPLQRRFRLDEQLHPTWPAVRGLEVVLEALPRAAFVIGPRNGLDLMNRHGGAMLEREGRRVIEAIRHSEHRPDDGIFEVTRLSISGHPPSLLAISKEPRPGVRSLVATAQSAWRLTAHQARVLDLVASGSSNREIAERLGCAKVTVEKHMTELFRRSGARSRAQLLVKLFSFGG